MGSGVIFYHFYIEDLRNHLVFIALTLLVKSCNFSFLAHERQEHLPAK